MVWREAWRALDRSIVQRETWGGGFVLRGRSGDDRGENSHEGPLDRFSERIHGSEWMKPTTVDADVGTHHTTRRWYRTNPRESEPLGVLLMRLDSGREGSGLVKDDALIIGKHIN